ncbi:hypothetical protein ACKZDW_11700 [Ralstonia syzygii subsp. celebesensis]
MVGFWFFLQGVASLALRPWRLPYRARRPIPALYYQTAAKRLDGSCEAVRARWPVVACTPVAVQPGNSSQARRLTNDRTSTMKTRTLGNSGLEVSELGLGCMGMRVGYGPISLSWNEPIAEASEPEFACAADERRGGVNQGVGRRLAGRTWHAAL